jgi:hypothetical protein
MLLGGATLLGTKTLLAFAMLSSSQGYIKLIWKPQKHVYMVYSLLISLNKYKEAYEIAVLFV